MNPKRVVARVKETAVGKLSPAAVSKFFEKSDFKTLKAAATLIDVIEVNESAKKILKDGKVPDHSDAAEIIDGLVDGLQSIARELKRIRSNRLTVPKG